MQPGMLLELVQDIDARNSQLLSGSGAEAVVEDVLAAARAAGVRSVTGATPIGYALCGAAIAQSGGCLSLWTAGQTGPVLVVDGITASHISPKMTQRRLEQLGVQASIHVVEIAKMASRNEPRANEVTVPEECLIAEERNSSHPLPARELLDAVRVA